MKQSTIDEMKADLIAKIKETVEPHLWQSGYIESYSTDGERVYTRLYVFGDDDDGFAISHTDEGTHTTLEGFTTTGIITDSYGGGLCVLDYESCMLEQLMFVLKIAHKIGEK